jgi:outer membrane receptor for ferrienterochelin and colicins
MGLGHLFLILALQAQAAAGTIRVEVQSASGGLPIAGATAAAGIVTATTSAEGIAVLSVPAGRIDVTVSRDGFLQGSAVVDVVSGQTQTVRIVLTARPAVKEEVTVVATTRTGRRVEDQPMRVEVLGREEIEEKMLMTPGDIVMMLNEMGGLRVQATSPSLGAASVRIQGMRGRYTQFLSDGLPLFGEQPGGLGLLQIPPMDLGQVEVVKGVASALYGAGAMGGVVNLLSRRPGDEPEREILFNQSTRGATDGVFWLSTPFGGSWGLTLLASGHYQKQTDVDDDGWADLAKYQRGVVRPRLFWDNKQGRSFFATAGITMESRRGGTVSGGVVPATGQPYTESLDTTRIDAGASGQTLVAGRYVFTARAAFSGQRHDHLFGDARERDRHDTAFGEAAWRGSAGRHTWVAGFAIEHDSFDPEDVPRFKYAFTTPGIFVQDDIDLTKMLIVSASGRVDWHSEYGTFFSPRVSMLLRPADSGSGEAGWSSRVSAGGGFFAPTPLTEETEAAGLTRLQTSGSLAAERGRSVSVDFSRHDGPLSWTVTVFASRIDDPLHVDRDDIYSLRTLDGETTNTGVELLATFRRSVFVATGTYTYVQSRESDAGVQSDVPLTPRHSAGFVAMAESEERGRVGLEIYFTGRQRLEANPLRDVSEPYVIIGLLGEHRFGRLSLFINGENLTGVRQSSWDPLVRSVQGVDGRWTVDAWAPLEGRVINGGVRIRF